MRSLKLLDFILQFLVIAERKQACLYPPGLAKLFYFSGST